MNEPISISVQRRQTNRQTDGQKDRQTGGLFTLNFFSQPLTLLGFSPTPGAFRFVRILNFCSKNIDVLLKNRLINGPYCLSFLFERAAPLGGCTQTTAVVLAEPEIPWRVSHPSIIQAQCCLTSVLNGNWCMYPTRLIR